MITCALEGAKDPVSGSERTSDSPLVRSAGMTAVDGNARTRLPSRALPFVAP